MVTIAWISSVAMVLMLLILVGMMAQLLDDKVVSVDCKRPILLLGVCIDVFGIGVDDVDGMVVVDSNGRMMNLSTCRL